MSRLEKQVLLGILIFIAVMIIALLSLSGISLHYQIRREHGDRQHSIYLAEPIRYDRADPLGRI